MARWHSCNVLQSGSDLRTLWQFSTGGGKYALQKEEARLPSEPLSGKTVSKDWHTLFQPKLNIAWLPQAQVFLRVIQLPKSQDPAETRSMVELQLEKISPMPVSHIVWGYEILPQPAADMQTVIVIIVARNQVEAFLGKLEGEGYLTDRLELPFLDQLRATHFTGDGVWIYPGPGTRDFSCLVAWWYGGMLQNLMVLHLPGTENRGQTLREQLSQMNWAGEVEGWLSSTPNYHIVAEPEVARQWLELFTAAEHVDVVAPPALPQLAAMTAQRVASNGLSTNLLPPEYTGRYRQQFVDRLWMRGLAGVLMLYVVGVLVYIGFVSVAKYQLSRVESGITSKTAKYTEAVKLREKVRVLQEQIDLQYAALDCYRAIAENLPEGLRLESLVFADGQKLTIFGTASSEETSKIQTFSTAMSKATVKDQPLFAKVFPPFISARAGNELNWNFVCELKRTDE